MASVGEEPELRILRWRRTRQEETRKADLGKSKERGSLQDDCGKTAALCGATAEPRSLGWSEQRGKNGEQRHLYWTIPGPSILICSPHFPGYQSEFEFVRLEAKAPSVCSVLLLRPRVQSQFWGSDCEASTVVFFPCFVMGIRWPRVLGSFTEYTRWLLHRGPWGAE